MITSVPMSINTTQGYIEGFSMPEVPDSVTNHSQLKRKLVTVRKKTLKATILVHYNTLLKSETEHKLGTPKV